MNSLGAGGEESPHLVNSANGMSFSIMVLTCSLSPALVKRIDIKGAFIFGTLGYCPYAAGLYCNNRCGTQWCVLFGAAYCGVCAGVFWSVEAAIALAYPEPKKSRSFPWLLAEFPCLGSDHW